MRRTVISKLKSSQKIGGLPRVNFDKGQTVLKLRLYLVLTWQDPIKQCYLPLKLVLCFYRNWHWMCGKPQKIEHTLMLNFSRCSNEKWQTGLNFPLKCLTGTISGYKPLVFRRWQRKEQTECLPTCYSSKHYFHAFGPFFRLFPPSRIPLTSFTLWANAFNL